jgi:hypothetical protein
LPLQAEPVLTQALKVELLKPVLIHASLLLKHALPLRCAALLLLDLAVVFRKPLLVTPLLLDLLLLLQLLLALLLQLLPLLLVPLLFLSLALLFLL